MTKGMSANVWSGDHVERLLKMSAEGVPYEEIASALGRSGKAIHAKLMKLRKTPEQLRADRAKRRKYAVEQYPSRKHGAGFTETSRNDPDEDVLAERNYRLGLIPRDLTAAMFGDPPPGYSALDRRAQQ